jgi:hypothetical protein
MDKSGAVKIGENGLVPGSMNPKRRLFFEYHTNPPVSMDSVNDVIKQLSKKGVDFLYMKLSKDVSEAMSNKQYMKVAKLLKTAYLPDEKLIITDQHIIPSAAIASSKWRSPDGNFHHDNYFAQDDLFDGVMNFWIPTKKVMGRPLAFVKSSTLSASQKITKAVKPPNDLDYDKANEYIFVPEMKGPGGSGNSGEDEELGDMIAFRADQVYHGSPELIDPKHQGDREVMIFTFYFNRK